MTVTLLVLIRAKKKEKEKEIELDNQKHSIMVKEQDPSLNERSFVAKALESGLRIDGRKPYDFRGVKIGLGPALGSCEVQLGKTRCV
jgi:hypothetical protein